jgi:hypothetical protein
MNGLLCLRRRTRQHQRASRAFSVCGALLLSFSLALCPIWISTNSLSLTFSLFSLCCVALVMIASNVSPRLVRKQRNTDHRGASVVVPSVVSSKSRVSHENLQMRTPTLHDWIQRMALHRPPPIIEIGCEDLVVSPPNKRYCCTQSRQGFDLVVVLVS